MQTPSQPGARPKNLGKIVWANEEAWRKKVIAWALAPPGCRAAACGFDQAQLAHEQVEERQGNVPLQMKTKAFMGTRPE
jgi:hypothetical protein